MHATRNQAALRSFLALCLLAGPPALAEPADQPSEAGDVRQLLASGEPTSGTLRLSDGTGIWVEQTGEGAPLILIPGWACSTDVFRSNIPAFAERFRVVAYDPRSQGASEQTPEGNGYAQRGEDLAELIEALDLSGVVLLGWSLGVYDVLAYVDRHGFDRVAALVLVDESPKIIKSGPDDWGEGAPEEIAGLIETVNGEGYLPFLREYMAAGFDGEAPAELLDQMTSTASALPPERAAALLEDAAQQDYSAASSRAAAAVPVLQIVREDWAAEAKAWIEANQPQARLEILGGHLMLIEYAEAFNASVLAFLEPWAAP